MILDQGARARRRTSYLAPPPGLEEVVVEGWVQRYAPEDPGAPGWWRVVPDLQPHLLVHADRAGRPGGVRVVGARSVHLDRPAGGRSWTVGVTLRPGTLGALTGLPARELLDRSAAAEALLSRRGRSLEERVAGAAGPEEVVRVLVGFVEDSFRRASVARDWRVRGFLEEAREGACPRVAAIADGLGVSARSLRDAWAREVGVSPSRALSIERLHRAVGVALRDPHASWSRVARRAGYYDQPHLVRDFRRLLGETPGAFLARGRPAG